MDLEPSLFVDLDYPETCRNKATIIRNRSELASVIFGDLPVDPSDRSPTIETPHYLLQPIDLTNKQAMEDFLSTGTIDGSLPTLFLSECVLIYINPDAVNPTLQYLQSRFPNSCFVVYEQIRPFDPFGKMMIRNLHVRVDRKINV